MGYIKQITIQGFKSYKDQMQIEPFSPNCNVIVGRNGSGKSNFFAAVRFVLGDDYHFLSREERQALLHEGSGSAVMSAYVEVCFDNTEDRFQTGKPEFFLRRTIGAKKDEYSVNRKNATRAEVQQILESAGFSRSNPYYIVPQGRVTALTNMKDTQRLKLLKEISGSNVYETRRADSLKLLSDTDSKCSNIDSVVASINERLDELEGEKEELEAWSRNDRERRSLIYTMKSREEAELEAEIERIDALEHQGRETREDNEAVFKQNEDRIAQIDKEINRRRGDLDILREDRVQYEKDRKAATLEKAKIELELKSSQDNQSAAQTSKKNRDAQVKSLREQIRTREAELQRILPQYNSKKDEEEAVRAQLLEAEGQRKRLQDKQGRGHAYSNKRQRDDALRVQIDETNADLSQRKAILVQTNEEVAQLQSDIERIETEIANIRSTIENEGDATVTLAAKVEKAKDAYKAVRDEQTNLQREEARTDSQLRTAQQELQRAEHTFSHLLDQNTSRGLETLRRYMREGEIPGVHGTIADLLQVPDHYRSVTEAAAEGTLFNVVVDDDNVASKIIDRLIKDRGGRLTFIPLNRVQATDMNLKPRGDMQPLLPKLTYEERFDTAFKHVFAKIVICPDLSTCKSVSNQLGVRAYTLDGDSASRKGLYRGGFHDPSKSRINAYRTVTESRTQFEGLQQRKREIVTELDLKRQQLTAAESEIRRRQHEKNDGESSFGPLREELRSKQRTLQDKRDMVTTQQAAASELQLAINRLGAQQSDWEGEIATDFKKTLSKDEEQMLNTLTITVNDLQKQFARIREERTAFEAQKVEAELELNENLQPNLDDVLAQQGGSGGSVSQSTHLRECERALKAVDRTIADLDAKIQDTDAQIEEIRGQLSELESSRAESENSNRDLAKAMERQEKNLSRKDQDRSRATDRLSDVKRDIRDLGTLPEDVDRKYGRWDTAKVAKELAKATQALKKFAHVNKKAYEQYENFTRQRKTLIDRRAELDTSRKSIENLIDVLDQRKDEAINRTFRQVAKAFQKVFQELVPIGTGRLLINRKSDEDAEVEESEDEDAQRRGKGSKVEEYISVSIAVSFNSKHDEQQKIGQLSGGQKSLCALALIFAIQQCDPAPFYLFDEIDANLDAQYRTAVANMLQKLSGQGGKDGNGGGQFICTTFRPEMVLVADRCYGVSYSNKTSSIDVVEREAALEFVDGMQK
ncbi:RecF/RecN/SMC protein [Dothidotthia symphoricarpi CBS 119687]|uniref:Structural maintenance of chromosomes protein n=1 Tax=Dothidotthia symphoricarpi CBS 119687 TaxID=1392245 RepID=A0A6A6AVF6_9PLEO|nr:RecF/RecN/SMC protein [Dothidotthia symphoricarpi CBS 119687]KAF2134945.1 RecF/RecN/SMC protein [Dothidotthia symphoricarpi CBS 119687]